MTTTENDTTDRSMTLAELLELAASETLDPAGEWVADLDVGDFE